MGKQPRLRPPDALQPVPCPPVMSSQSFVFLLGPPGQVVVQAAQARVQCRAGVAAVVGEPPPQHRITHPRQIGEHLVTAPRHGPASHRVAHLLGCLRADCRSEVGEVASKAILGLPRANREPEKVKVLLRICPSPHTILAVDHPGLLRMDSNPQSAKR
jgi:hypothetical protein